ncbi:MBL fold metallo-hydrolase [Hydrogenophaga sp.]|uniref:MBL fold metallo-hydrolase n=1 Tax=Hydrogenophaga sp. TaxID=1904254 RepID=UPI0027248291|nr:MBL fold metallo-hydrolase [Hydrogenophaga sp.]MDO9435894.1 MBL fold metallo-hydrolase [Hydrogenophaga sp.]
MPPTTSASHDATAVLARTGVTCLERGWLSANNILIRGEGPTALVDSGYGTHEEQTISLVASSLGSDPLDLLLNTHLHSDHCGGNSALQQAYPALRTLIPPGQSEAVAAWDTEALTYEATGQLCPRFVFQALLAPGSTIRLGSWAWDIHAAKGHDPHSIVLFQPQHRLLISADALWENGFGVVFPELEGIAAFDEVADTLCLIEELAPTTVIPGHGSVFVDVDAALARARSRLEQFIANPNKHRRHALKVLIKFKLLEWQSVSMDTLHAWARSTWYFTNAMPSECITDVVQSREWLLSLLSELERSQALSIDGDLVANR